MLQAVKTPLYNIASSDRRHALRVYVIAAASVIQRLPLLTFQKLLLSDPALPRLRSRAPSCDRFVGSHGSAVSIIPRWNYIDVFDTLAHHQLMPRTRMDELVAIAEGHDGLLTSREARVAGIQDSVLVRLAQRGRLERMSRGVYRIAHYPADRLAQYREAVLWAKASQGPVHIALSHETALLLYGISDANPARVSLTVPPSARLRRVCPGWIAIHRANLAPEEIGEHEGMPVTTVERSIMDVLTATHGTDFARRSVTDALREGLVSKAAANRLRRSIAQVAGHQSPPKSGAE